MMRSILVATDLSEASDVLVRAAAALASLTEAELHLVHAIEVPVLPYSPPDAAVTGITDRRDEARDELAAQLERAAPNVEAVSVEVVVGPVHGAILERAAEVEADLIVIGPHRLRPFADRFLGSTADRVIRTSGVPCLLVRGALDLPLRRVMVPTDLSDASNAALDVALQWAGALGVPADAGAARTEVQVVHIVPRMYEMPDFAFDEEVILPELERVLQRATEHAVPAGVLRPHVTWGDLPADEILRVAESDKADLIVAGTRGHGAVRRALLGSVASAVARGAPCPLLLVPSTGGDKPNEH